MPTYNGAAFLEAALTSIARQDLGSAIEVIAVDDGSTDDTLDILTRWQSRLQLHVQVRQHTGNWVASTNEALSKARGTWISWLHQDDAWLPGRIQQLLHLADEVPDVDFFLHPAEFRDEDNRQLGIWRCPFKSNCRLTADDILPKLIVQNTIPICSPMIKRDRCLQAGPMDAELWYFADWDYWLKLAAVSICYYHVEPLAVFRLHHGSQTIKRTGALTDVGQQFDITTERALAKMDPTESHQRSLQRLVRLSRATYLLMLSTFHDAPSGTLTEFLRAAFRVGPIGWWRYACSARLIERVLPRLRLIRYQKKNRT